MGYYALQHLLAKLLYLIDCVESLLKKEGVSVCLSLSGSQSVSVQSWMTNKKTEISAQHKFLKLVS